LESDFSSPGAFFLSRRQGDNRGGEAIMKGKPEAATSGLMNELRQTPEAQSPLLITNASSGCLQDWNDARCPPFYCASGAAGVIEPSVSVGVVGGGRPTAAINVGMPADGTTIGTHSAVIVRAPEAKRTTAKPKIVVAMDGVEKIKKHG
jgi:hypothetical protein